MEPPWRPVPELLPGHYAVGKLLHGGEARVYNAGGFILDVENGFKILIIGWRPLEVHLFNTPPVQA